MKSAPRRFPVSGIPAGLALLIAGMLAAGSPAAADMRNGSRIYSMHCAGCHDESGAPVLPGAPDFRRGTALLRPDAQIVASLKTGRGGMPTFVGILKERELLDVVAYLRTLN